MIKTVRDLLDAVDDGNMIVKTWRDEIETVDEIDDLWGELHGESGETDYAIKDVGPLVVHDSTGGMDEGSNATVVFSIGDTYFRKSGYYASHYGYDWDGDLEVVVPAEKTITVYKTL